MRQWTKDGWDVESFRYQLETSQAVLKELEKGDHLNKTENLNRLRDIPRLPINMPGAKIVEICIQRKLMPAGATGDALYLALASFYNCNYLLTWSCQHFANANNFGHIRRINGLLRLSTPELVAPLELVQENL